MFGLSPFQGGMLIGGFIGAVVAAVAIGLLASFNRNGIDNHGER